MKDKNRICPVEQAGALDIYIRRWFQNPDRILGPYLKQGMSALDFGCGPGFFTVEMAKLVGSSGRVIACDVQDGMLEKLAEKVKTYQLENIVKLHKCGESEIGYRGTADFILAFYMIHELKDKKRKYFKEMFSILKSGGILFIAEPPMHVSAKQFSDTVRIAESAGFVMTESPSVFLSKTALFVKK